MDGPFLNRVDPRLSLPVVEPVDDALGLRGARLPGEGHVRLEAGEQRKHLVSLSRPFSYNFHFGFGVASPIFHMPSRILSPNKN